MYKNLFVKMRKPEKCANELDGFKKEGVFKLCAHTRSLGVWLPLNANLNFRNCFPPVLVVARTSRGRFKAPFEPGQSLLGME